MLATISLKPSLPPKLAWPHWPRSTPSFFAPSISSARVVALRLGAKACQGENKCCQSNDHEIPPVIYRITAGKDHDVRRVHCKLVDPPRALLARARFLPINCRSLASAQIGDIGRRERCSKSTLPLKELVRLAPLATHRLSGRNPRRIFCRRLGSGLDLQFADGRVGNPCCNDLAVKPVHRAEKIGDIGAVGFVIDLRRRSRPAKVRRLA